MKIVNVLIFFPKLSETFILDHLCALSRRKFNIQIVSMHSPFKKLANENSKYEKKVHVEIKKYELLKFNKYVGVDLDGGIRDAVSMGAEIIHFHFLDLLFYVKDLRLFKKVPIVVTIHTKKNLISFLSLDDYHKSVIIKNVSLFIVTYNRLKLELISLGFPKEKVRCLHYGVDLDFFKRPLRHRFNKEVSKLIFVGRLIPKKGLEYLIGALGILKKERIKIFLNIIGSGKSLLDLRKYAKKLGVENMVNFLGECTRSTILEKLLDSDIFVLPAITDSNDDEDGTPLSIMEAAACSLPIVSTRIGGISELVSDGQSGFLIEEKSSNAIARSILEFIQQPSLREKFGFNGRLLMQKRFALSKYEKNICKIYKSLKNTELSH